MGEQKKDTVAFWSPMHGQGRNTSNMASVGTWICENYVLKTLLMHNQYEKSNLEGAFRAEKDLETDGQKGIDGIEKCVRSSNFRPADFPDYTEEILSQRLYLLQGSNKVYKYDKEKLADAIEFILHCGKQYYDLILSDVNSGTKDEITRKVMDRADLIVVSLNQNIKLLKGFFEGTERHEILDKDKKYIIVLGNYDSDSKYTAKYIKKIFNYKDEIYTIPYNIEFLDAHNDHNLHEFFIANNDVNKKDKNYYFIEEVKKLALRIMKELEMDIAYKEKPIEVKTVIKSFINLFKEEGE